MRSASDLAEFLEKTLRTELPHLPSSRAALLEVAGSTRTSRFADYQTKVTPLDWVVTNGVQLPVEIKEKEKHGD